MWPQYIILISGIVYVCAASASFRDILDKQERERNVLVKETIWTSFLTLDYQWQYFKNKYNKVFSSAEEEISRLKIFAENIKLIAEHNDMYNKGVVTYSVEMNKLGDRTLEERMQMLGFKAVLSDKNSIQPEKVYIPPSGLSIPSEKDWRKDGAVTPVKNQGDCGSCWAFSATGALEAQYFRATKQLLELSEQNLIDCSSGFGNDGCQYGSPEMAFKYIEENGGIDTEKSYPYEAYTSDHCRYESKYAGVSTEGYEAIPMDESVLQKAVFAAGPISVSVDAAGFGFHFYKNGIYYNGTCEWQYDSLNHAVLVVGYGNIINVGDYWLVKNSWGEDWGMNGYILTARNRDNNCGIATNAVLPRIKTGPGIGEHL